MIRGGHAERVFARYLKQLVDDAEDILDIGTSQRFAKELRPYEGWFDGKKYIAAGYRPRALYCRYDCDCHQDIPALTFGTATFDAVLCIEVLEHTADPLRAVSEINRVLRPNGKVLLTTPFLAHYHGKRARFYSPDNDSYPDFWRFTHQGLKALFRDFRLTSVHALDGLLEFRLKQVLPERCLAYGPVRKLVDSIDRPRPGRATTRHLVYAVK